VLVEPLRPTLDGPRVRLRPGETGDIRQLLALLREPSVAAWWNEPPGEAEVADLLAGREHDGVMLAIEVEGAVAGGIQLWEELDPEYRHAGIDVFLGSRWQGYGLGGEAVWLAARYLFEERGHHRLTIDPSAGNARAIRCYERLGFRPVGVLRQYERGPDGQWRDGLLMDMLTGELLRPTPA